MSKLALGNVKELQVGVQKGKYLLEIEEVERGKNRDGYLSYTFRMKIIEPKSMVGRPFMDWITVGTEKDPKAREASTTESESNYGAKRLVRLLVRSETPISDEDDDWMQACEGNRVACEVGSRTGNDGITYTTKTYYREDEIDDYGLEDSGGSSSKSKVKGKGPAAVAKRVRELDMDDDDDDDDEDERAPRKGKLEPDDDDDDDDDEDDEDEDESPPAKTGKRGRPKGSRNK